jgi:hypothetical protein
LWNARARSERSGEQAIQGAFAPPERLLGRISAAGAAAQMSTAAQNMQVKENMHVKE